MKNKKGKNAKNAGRPAIGPSVSICLLKAQIAWLDSFVDEGMSRSSIVRKLVADALKSASESRGGV